ncbi:MAG: thaumatin family protein [Nitrospirota bacterium]
MKMRLFAYLVVLTFSAVMFLQVIPCNANSQSHYVMFINNCSYPIWVGQFGETATSPSDGWKMDNSSIIVKTIENGWSGRFWPRTGCTFDSTGVCPNPYADCCITGGCIDNESKFAVKCAQGGNPPTSLFELTLDAPDDTVYGPYDTVDISYVDGFGVPVMVTPVYPYDPPKIGNPGGGDNPDPAHWCKTMGHTANPACPDNMMLSDGVSCYSPCQYAIRKLNLSPKSNTVANICCSNSNVQKDGYNCIDDVVDGKTTDSCCAQDKWAGGYGCSPYVLDNITLKQKYNDNEVCNALDTTNKRSYWGNIAPSADPLLGAKALQYVSNVHAATPGVYSWQFDDKSSTYHCRLTRNVLNYVVAFCPNDFVPPMIAMYGLYSYGSNSTIFGTPTAQGVTTDGQGNYALHFTNGTSILSASDGYIYTYINGKWAHYTDTISPNGVQWSPPK